MKSLSTALSLLHWRPDFLVTFRFKSPISVQISILLPGGARQTFANIASAHFCSPQPHIQEILAKPRAEVSKEKTKTIGSGCATFYWHLYVLYTFLLAFTFSFSPPFFWILYFLSAFLLKSLLSLYLSIEILAFLSSDFLLKFRLTLYFSIEISSVFFLLQSPLSLLFSSDISTFSSFFFWDLNFLYFLITFLLKLLFSFTFYPLSFELSTFFLPFDCKSWLNIWNLLFFWNLAFSLLIFAKSLLFTFLVKFLHSLY